MTKKETILDKVHKLLAKAKGTDSLAEAETFMAKANELLMMHELSMMDVEIFRLGQDKNQQIVEDGGNEYFKNDQEGQWEIDLISLLAKHHFCTVFFSRYRDKKFECYPKFTLIGTAENIAVVKMLFDHFKDLIKVIGEGRYVKEVWKVREQTAVEATSLEEAALYLNMVFSEKKMNILTRWGYRAVPYPEVLSSDVMPKCYAENMKGVPQPYFVKNLKKFELFPYRATYIKSFLLGACCGFDKKLREQRKGMIDSTVIGSQVTALVHVKDAAIKKYMAEHHPRMNSFKSSTASDGRGYTHGVEEGGKLSIREGIHGSTAKAIS